MSGKGFENELARALARPDVEKLKAIVEDYYPDAVWIWSDARKDSDLALALLSLAAATFDDAQFLATIAACLVEDLISHQPALNKETISEELLARILDESRRTPRFRWMLSGVWFGQEMKPAHVAAIREATKDCHMDHGAALPPRPWA